MPAPLGSQAPISFDDALRQAEQAGGGMHLLLGNGFSIGAHPKFDYSSLYDEAAKTNSLSQSAMAIFEQYKTRNFEGVLQKLRDAEWFSDLYGINEGKESLLKDHFLIKNALISAIESVHPNQSDLPEGTLESAESFLGKYSTIFSICYDLLLYWTMNIRAPAEYRFQDGFAGKNPPQFTERIDESQILVCFLHGALHLIQEEEKTIKLVRGTSLILPQVRESISREKYPLIVSEGQSSMKEATIYSNRYLRWSFARFRSIQGSLFTYGTSLSESDEHIRSAIVENMNLRALYVGIYPRSIESERKALEGKALQLQERREAMGTGPTLAVHFYDSSSANVWGRTLRSA